jgi:two-component sensor histidine kinase
LKIFFVAFFYLLTWQAVANGEGLSIDPHISKQNIYPRAETYVDKGAKESIESIAQNPSLFQPTHTEFGNFGYSLRDAIWVKFVLNNPTDETLKRLIVFSNPFTDVVNLYTAYNGVFREYQSGILNKASFDNTLQFTFPAELKPNETRTYYLKLEPRTGSLVFNLTLENEHTFYAEEVRHQMVLFLFFGAMAALIIYNAFLFFVSRDSVYIYYVFYLLSITVQHLSLAGIIYYLLPYENKSIVLTEAYLSVYFVNAVAISTVLFVRSFLKTRQYPKFDMFLKIDILIAMGIALGSSHEYYLLDWGVYHGFFTIILILSVGIHALRRGNKRAIYYVVAWSIALSGIFALIAYRSNLFDVLTYMPYYFEGTLITEALLFSVVLANKLNGLNKEKLQLNTELVKQQQTEQIRLNKLVDERTDDLNRALETHKVLLSELHHRVKNNMQFIVSLYALKLHQYGNKEIDAKLKDIESKIKAMGQAHEMLYHQEDLNAIESSKYFYNLIQSVSKAYDMSKIEVVATIDNIMLTASEAIYSGLILNELLINAIKYAFDQDGGELYIHFHQSDQSKELKISDTGRGIPDGAVGTSFGLLMVKTLSEEQLHGTFNQHSSHFSIAF